MSEAHQNGGLEESPQRGHVQGAERGERDEGRMEGEGKEDGEQEAEEEGSAATGERMPSPEPGYTRCAQRDTQARGHRARDWMREAFSGDRGENGCPGGVPKSQKSHCGDTGVSTKAIKGGEIAWGKTAKQAEQGAEVHTQVSLNRGAHRGERRQPGSGRETPGGGSQGTPGKRLAQHPIHAAAISRQVRLRVRGTAKGSSPGDQADCPCQMASRLSGCQGKEVAKLQSRNTVGRGGQKSPRANSCSPGSTLSASATLGTSCVHLTSSLQHSPRTHREARSSRQGCGSPESLAALLPFPRWGEQEGFLGMPGG